MELPINTDLIQMRKEIPLKLAELSYKDEEIAIKYMREWGERKIPISLLHEKLSKELDRVAL